MSERVRSLSVPIGEVLDPQLWRERYVHGLLLGQVAAQQGGTLSQQIARAAARGRSTLTEELDEQVSGIPDEAIRWHLRVSLSEVGLKLGVPMETEIIKATPVDTGLKRGVHFDREVPRLPYTRAETNKWFMLMLEPNVVSVERIRAFWYDSLVWEISSAQGNHELIAIQHPRQGQVHIVPRNLHTLALDRAGNYGAWFNLMGAVQQVPYFWAVDYTRGPIARDGQPMHIEAVLAHYVYATAGLTLLALDSVARTKGITSSSLSLDGVSRSISVNPNLHQALADVWEKSLERIDWKALRTAHRGLRLRMFGG